MEERLHNETEESPLDQLQVATFSMRLKAACLDGIIVSLVAGLLIAGIALAFPNDVAFPFFRQTQTLELQSNVQEEGDTTITNVTYVERQYDVRNHLISECIMEATIKQSPGVTTKFARNVEPCKRGVMQLDSLTLLLILLYGTYFEMGPRSSTLGKKLVGIRVVRVDGTPLSLGRALWRNLAEFLSYIFFIGYLFALFGSKKRALHDLMAGTLVVRSAPQGGN